MENLVVLIIILAPVLGIIIAIFIGVAIYAINEIEDKKIKYKEKKDFNYIENIEGLSKSNAEEINVANILSTLSSCEYIVLNDIMINNGKNTVQIDHIVVSLYGIFIIETKDYFGSIYGKSNDTYWTQFARSKKFKFSNPIHQNYGHVLGIKGVLSKFTNLELISVISFSNKSKLHVISNIIVTNSENLKEKICKYKEKKYLNYQIVEMAEIIKQANIIDEQKRNTHNLYVKKTVQMNEMLEKYDVCPRCNSKIIVKKSKYGEFKACSNYPRCKYVPKEPKM